MEGKKDKKVIMQTIPNIDNELIGFTNICRWKDIKSETNYIEIATRCTPRSLLAYSSTLANIMQFRATQSCF